MAFCQCDCGSEPIYVKIGALRKIGTKSRPPTRSCGCLHREKVTTHGSWGNPLLSVWSHMMSRCYDLHDKRYERYGGRGITVCYRWHDVRNFINDMQDRYVKGLQIDRKDNDKGYFPDNCHWVDTFAQAQNKSNVPLHTHNGKTLCLAEWSRVTGLSYACLRDRLKRGWDIHKTLTTPTIPIPESMPIALATRWGKIK